ncbi:MAG: hypothetical protein GWN58_47345, partial [Anaerolineae bacterium]|nr:hypothetical protein [Anaerolineae bacterium]
SIDNYTNGTKGGQPDFWTVKRRFKCRNRAHLVVGETDLIPPIVQGAQVALVFVNVDHRREQLDKDIAAWKPLVEPGGIMAFDGYGSDRWPDVQAVVDEAMGDWTRLDCTGNVQAFEKG